MLASVAQDIHERVPDLAWRPEIMAMVAVAPDAPAADQEAIQGARGPNAETPHARRERPCVMGLDDQVEMVPLHRKVHDAKVGTLRGPDGARDGVEETRCAEGRKIRARPQRDVNGVAIEVPRAGAVQDTRPRPGLPAGAPAPTAPGIRHGQRELSGAPGHLE